MSDIPAVIDTDPTIKHNIVSNKHREVEKLKLPDKKEPQGEPLTALDVYVKPVPEVVKTMEEMLVTGTKTNAASVEALIARVGQGVAASKNLPSFLPS